MSVIYILLPLSLLAAGGFVLAFVWAARSGQFDDMQTPPARMLFDDEPEEGAGEAGDGFTPGR